MNEVTVFTPPHPLRTAVLFLVFNRLDTTKQVFEAIRQAKPPRLYVAGDGPRADRPSEDKKVQSVREYVMNSIDWDCEVKTLFQENNLGCKYAVSGSISWFLENEEMGIILEDDCLPSQSFFWFCEELLERYKEDERIMIISGFNKQETWNDEKYDYFYSYFGGIWGWASWKRAWKLYDGEMKDLNYCVDNGCLKYLLGEKLGKIREKQMIETIENRIDSWAFPWGFARHVNSGLACVPSKSLIENIGFGSDATHTKGNDDNPVKKHEIQVPLRRNHIMIPDLEYDMLFHLGSGIISNVNLKVCSYLKESKKSLHRKIHHGFL
jgi:hypothetical protein